MWLSPAQHGLQIQQFTLNIKHLLSMVTKNIDPILPCFICWEIILVFCSMCPTYLTTSFPVSISDWVNTMPYHLVHLRIYIGSIFLLSSFSFTFSLKVISLYTMNIYFHYYFPFQKSTNYQNHAEIPRSIKRCVNVCFTQTSSPCTLSCLQT